MKPFHPFSNYIITSHGRYVLEVINDEMLETIEYVKCMTDKSMPFHLCYAEEVMADEYENEHIPTGYLCDSQTSKHESNLFNLTDKSKLVQNENIKSMDVNKTRSLSMAKGEDLKGRNVKMYNREHLTEEDILHKINNVEVLLALLPDENRWAITFWQTVNSDLTRLKEHIRVLNLPN